MIYLKTEEEIELLRAANQLISATLAEIAKVVKPGVTTLELDALAEQFIRDHGATPTFKGFPASFPDTDPFPASICASVNEVVVHGLQNHLKMVTSSLSIVEHCLMVFVVTQPTRSVLVKSAKK